METILQNRNARYAGAFPIRSIRTGNGPPISATQGTALNFPIVADPDRTVAKLYGMIHPKHDEVYTVRTVFVVDPAKKNRLTITYPQTAGRNFDEILRVIDSLQLTDGYSVSTPPTEDFVRLRC